mmetsp:Transcript_71058/g.139613  ORF Transcript_71058/g.139613 Transcript_71058/m.139613 type:complete len:200 (-) Transcript_71058:557-1156(-)
MSLPSLEQMAAAVLVDQNFSSDEAERLLHPPSVVDALAKEEQRRRSPTTTHGQDEMASALRRLLQEGETAVITGLTVRSDLNGTLVKLLKMIEEKARWAVRCSSTNVKVCVRPQNLFVLPKQTKVLLKAEIDRVRDEMIHSAMQVLMMRNDRAESWKFIRDGYRTCPQIALHEAFEINDRTVPKPILVSLPARCRRQCL